MGVWIANVETHAVLYGTQDYEPPIDTRILDAVGSISLGAAVVVGVVGGALLWRQNKRLAAECSRPSEVPSPHEKTNEETPVDTSV